MTDSKTEKMVEITESRLAELEEAEHMLGALECAGVDNWQGYDLAMEHLDL